MPLRVAMALIMMIATISPSILAQSTNSNPFAITIQETAELYRIQGGDTLPASWYAPAYLYEMVYDPTCRTNFIFTECKKNGGLLWLEAWNYKALIHAPSELMSFNSRTSNFLAHAGDTISFYRSVRWYNPRTSRMDTTNYYALDTLEMVVHLVRVEDGAPIQLDSLGILPRTTPGMPTIYGARPIMALVSYQVPEAFDGDSIFVGVTVRARGSGPYHFMRVDDVTVGESERLKDAWYQNYLTAFGSVYAKRTIDELRQASGEEGTVLKVASVPGSPRDLRITFNGPSDGGFTAVAIYDEAGNLVFYPYNSRTGSRESETMYRAPSSGAYFVTLVHNGRIVKTQKTIIAQ